MALTAAPGLAANAANPPICPYVIDWSSQIGAWAQGAPWIKVHYAFNISPAKSTGAKVFYRPWDADSTYHDDGCLPSARTGSQYADMVWAKISGLNPKPDAVAYRNEFNWDNPTCSKRTCAEFVNYKNRLRTLGYTGKIIFGSFGVGWVDSNIWNDSDLTNAVNASDGVETHEYFDLQVNCCAPWLAFRHRDIAIANHPYLQSKEWYIGEFGSDLVCGHCPSCDDPQCRGGWRDNNKLTEQAYIDQMGIYRAGCANQVVAVFVFQVGSPGWANYEVFGTSVATWMKTTWNAPTGTISGTVKNAGGVGLSGAIVTANPGGLTATSGTGGAYTINNVIVGTYDVTAKLAGYGQQTQTGKTVSGGQTTTVNFVLTPITPISTAKGLADGSAALVSGIVTAQFPVAGSQERIYIENPVRSNGIAVTTAVIASLGDEVQAGGTVGALDGERVLNATSVVKTQTGGSVPKYLGMGNLGLGGGWFGRQSAVLNASPDSYAGGLSNIGLLARAWGRVSYVDPGGAYFHMDDGSGINDGSGQTGVRVACSGLPLPTGGTYVMVTGVSGATLVGGKVVRLLRPRSEADLSYRTGTNYLMNPGFETGTLANWTVYGAINGPQTGAWFGGITAHSGAWFLGTAADGGTVSGGVYQRIAAASGADYQARVWSRVFHGDNPENSAQSRVGIDPTGGTDSAAGSVAWSAFDTQPIGYYSEWRELDTQVVTCSSGYVTVFLDGRQANPAGWHINCFDDAGVYLCLD